MNAIQLQTARDVAREAILRQGYDCIRITKDDRCAGRIDDCWYDLGKLWDYVDRTHV